MLSIFKHLGAVTRFNSLPPEKRRITFYCEGKTYWPHLSGLLHHILDNFEVDCCYVSSSDDDPGLAIQHPRLQTFKIDSGFVRNWFFENAETDVMVMTMPDLNQFQVKRSKHDVHYIYVQHSLVSLHMIYREGAFDYFDSVFCSGPHHVKEVEALVEKRSLSAIKAVPHGYGRLDSLIKKRNPGALQGGATRPNVLIAPTWGPAALIEGGAAEPLIEQLLQQDCEVVLRPHPQTIRLSGKVFDALIKRFTSHSNFSHQTSVDGETALINSDLLISDWSGSALEYGFGLHKPVIFIDVPKKINNPDYESLEIEPFESSIRSHLGQVVKPGDDFDVREILKAAGKNFDTNKYVFNVGNSDKIGAEYIVSQSQLSS